MIKIIKKEFDWVRPLRPLVLSQITAIAVHHMEHLKAGMDDIHRWHIDRGWKGFAYNYWIDYEGNIFECRGLNKGGGLYDPHNDYTISIGFQGHYDITKEMPNTQYNSGVELIKYLKEKVPTINLTAGHKYWQPEKTCPGKYFPLEKMIGDVKNMSTFKDNDKISNWAKQAVKTTYELGIFKGDSNGNFNPKENCTREELAEVIYRTLQLINK